MNKTIKAISLVAILSFFSKFMGFIREMIIAAYYGATYQTDAYNMAVNIVGFSIMIISASVSTIIIPMYNHKRIQQGKKAADLFLNNTLWITSFLSGILAIIGIIFAPALVSIFAPSFNNETSLLTVDIARIIFIFIIVINISNYMMSIARIYEKFTIIVISNYPFTILTSLFIVFWAKSIGIYALVLGYILFLITQSLILILSVRKIFYFKASINFSNGDFKEVAKLSAPIFISVAVSEINAIISKILASSLPEGSISAMNYANTLRELPDGIITASVLTVTFPILSQYAAKKDFNGMKIVSIKAISLLLITLLPIIAICINYSTEITTIIFERGAFTSSTTALTSNIFIFTILSLTFSGSATLLCNVFYSMKDTKTPQIAAVFMVACNITLGFIFIKQMQAAGLALGTSIAYFVYFIVLFILLKKKLGSLGVFSLFKNVIKYIIAITGMIPIFILCELLRNLLPLFIFFAVASAVSLCVYALFLYLLKAELFMEALSRGKNYLKSRFKKKENQT